ncbi:MAG: hypothetical protein JXA54_09060 [Candidatus Heimdallarchaeota archaeon]|nr:hypothetical protein [Candidatus Heimdallarchaeota archaeon]
MGSIREVTQKIIKEFDNESCYAILTSAATIPFLEEPLNRARFFNYDKKLELYFDSKDLNRFSRLKDLTEIIANRIGVKKISGFEKHLKSFGEHGLMIQEKEGPSEGMYYKGFGGVHSHYDLTPLGKAILIFQTTLRCPSINFRKIKFTENWAEFFQSEMDLIVDSITNNNLKVKHNENCFSAKRIEASIITQLIFEFLAGATSKVNLEDIRAFIFDKAGEIHLGEIPGAIEQLTPLLQLSSDYINLNDRGRLVSCGYANIIIESALMLDDTEIIHYMVSAKSLTEGSRLVLENFAFHF